MVHGAQQSEQHACMPFFLSLFLLCFLCLFFVSFGGVFVFIFYVLILQSIILLYLSLFFFGIFPAFLSFC